MEEMVVLDPEECRTLLDTDTVGRVAFSTPAGPRIVPVNYQVVGETVAIRTTAYSELATYGPGAEVAFEIDQLDSERRRGWSVVAHGRCERVTDADELHEIMAGTDAVHAPWAGGVRPVVLRLDWHTLSGRRVGGEHWPHPVVSGRKGR